MRRYAGRHNNSGGGATSISLSGSTAPASARQGQASLPRAGRFDITVLVAAAGLAALGFLSMLGSIAPLIFLTAGGLLFFSDVDRSIDALARNWPLLVLPLYTILTVFWSEYPALSLRYGVQLTLTCVIAVLIATRLTVRQFITSLFIVFALVMVASVIFGRERLDDIALGIFASKNAYAANISIFLLLALAVAFDRLADRRLRVVAVMGIVISPYLLLRAQGSGASVSVVVATIVFLALLLSARMNLRTRRAYFGLALIGILMVAVPAALFGDEIMSFILVALGKDPTITGRTDLWTKGLEYIGERPLFGVGYQAFWVQGFDRAEELWAMFMISNRGGFHFHNAYISIAVELGLVGALISTTMLYAGFSGALYRTLSEPTALNSFFVAFAVMLIGRSFVEVDVFFQFSIPTVIVIAGLIMMSRSSRSKRTGYLMMPQFSESDPKKSGRFQ